MEILIWIWILTWMAKTAAQDVIYAVKGQPNPRYELKLQKALAAGHEAPTKPRYGTRDWFADLYSDALVAQTEKRRAKNQPVREGQPVDDMLTVAKVRPGDQPAPVRRRPAPAADDEPGPVPVVNDDQHTCKPKPEETTADDRPKCGRLGCFDGRIIGHRQWPGEPTSTPTADQLCDRCGWLSSHTTGKSWDEQWPTSSGESNNQSDVQPLATVIPMFPTLKEVTMSNAEITGLPTAIHFAKGMVHAHKAASVAGGEQYVAALRHFEVGDGTIASVATAREMSAQAAAAWDRVVADLAKQTTVKEAYEAVPDAGNKRFVTGE